MSQLALQQAFELALRHHQAGQLQQAEQIYRQILAQQPGHADALHFLGIIAHQSGRNDLAVDLIRQAITHNPDYPEAYSNLGVALKDLGQLDAAIAAQRQAIALKPDYVEAHFNLGVALKDQGQLDAALAAFRQALALNPGFPEAYNNLGVALSDKGQLDEAIAAYRQAIALKPDYPEAHNNLGVALGDKGQRDEAVASFRQAIVLQPDYSGAYCNLGKALKDQGQLDAAVAACRQAIALNPGYPDAFSNLGNALKDQGHIGAAVAAYRQALALAPGNALIHSNLIYALHYQFGCDSKAVIQELHHWTSRHAEPLRQLIPPHANDRGPERRLRIGYVSADFQNHASAFFLVPLLTGHDHQHCEIFCYHVTPPDHMTKRTQALADHWRSTVGLTDEAVAALIQRDQIDILVDLKLHTNNNRLLIFARKPAPVQVTWLGYPGSTGLNTIDYRLSDPYLDPPGMEESIYTEKTMRLPDSFWCYDPLDVNPPAIGPLPALANGYVTFGCLNNFCKVNEAVLRLWAKVLHAVPASRLLLLAPAGTARSQVLQVLEREGIDPRRIEFASHQPRPRYLQLYQRIDLGLDSFPYNGHTTSLDSIWMGVPVVTLVGQTAVGRAGLSLLSNVGLPELAARSEEEYVRIAGELAGDFSHLGHLRATLRQRMEQSPLMDAPRFTRNMEAAYRDLWRRWCTQVPALR